MIDLYNADCKEIAQMVLKENSIDTIITDPPYGLEFMGKGWDKGVPGVEFWKEFLAVTKPGGMLLAFGGTRTYHRLACAIEDAGWEIRDCMMWLYGSGFPKSHDISKGIDKALGAEREKVRTPISPRSTAGKGTSNEIDERPWLTKARELGYNESDGKDPVTDAAKAFNGWGTALKPAWEPIIVAMKPLDGTFAQNAEKWGVAGINVDGSRIATDGRPHRTKIGDLASTGIYGAGLNGSKATGETSQGRWPANLLLDEESGALLDEQSGIQASRFFYCSKASKSERNAGLENLPAKFTPTMGNGIGAREHDPNNVEAYQKNFHPTVKPLKLMEYLCTLTKTPTGGIVLDPFMGSGTTGLAAKNTGRSFIGCELSAEYFKIAEARINAPNAKS